MTEEWIEKPLALPLQTTSVCAKFLCEHVAYHMFVDHIFETSEFADSAASTITKLSQVVNHTKSDKERLDDEHGPFTASSKIFLPLIAEMVWCRGVNNFLTYLSHLLGLIFRTKPEMLRSSKMARLDVILAFESIESLIDHLAEKRVHDLVYTGLPSLQETLQNEIGFSLFSDEERMKRAILIVETRNLIVHNRAVVNDMFMRRTGADWVKPGDKDQVGLECAMRCLRFLAAVVLDIDIRAQEKFSLEATLLKEECNKCVSTADTKRALTFRCCKPEASEPTSHQGSELPSVNRTTNEIGTTTDGDDLKP